MQKYSNGENGGMALLTFVLYNNLLTRRRQRAFRLCQSKILFKSLDRRGFEKPHQSIPDKTSVHRFQIDTDNYSSIAEDLSHIEKILKLLFGSNSDNHFGNFRFPPSHIGATTECVERDNNKTAHSICHAAFATLAITLEHVSIQIRKPDKLNTFKQSQT